MENLPITTETAVNALLHKPEFEALPQQAQQQILNYAAADSYKNELQGKVKLAKLNYQDIKNTFLANCQSAHTKESYGFTLTRLELYLGMLGKSFGELSPMDADKLILSDFFRKPLKNGLIANTLGDRADSSVRKDVAALSAFYTYVSRVTNFDIANPVRGTKAKPKRSNKKQLAIPSEADVLTILKSKEIPLELRAAFAIMALRGLRVGGLLNLEINYEARTFTTISKGKDYKGTFNDALVLGDKAVLDYFKCFEGKLHPFKNLTDERIKSQVAYYMKKLFKKGLISNVYSCHDFRHFYATNTYNASKDIYRLKGLLNHSTISATEIYLRSLNLL